MIFVGDVRDYCRKRAYGYKSITIQSGIAVGDYVDFFNNSARDRELVGTDEGAVLYVQPESEVSEQYMLVLREIGVFGKAHNISADIDVLFCDGGYMFVVLQRGSIAIKMPDGSISIASVGDSKLGKITLDELQRDLKWVSTEDLLAYKTYWGEWANFVFDFQFRFIISGGASSFYLRLDTSNCRDLSLGVYNKYVEDIRQEISRKESELYAREMLESGNSLQLYTEGSDVMEYDYDEDMDEEEYEDVL